MATLIYTQEDIDNGLILPDSDMGKQLGLTSDKFYDGSYLWYRKENNTLYLSMLMSRHEHQGNVLAILQAAKSRCYNMEACSVSIRMTQILLRFGFRRDPVTGYMVFSQVVNKD